MVRMTCGGTSSRPANAPPRRGLSELPLGVEVELLETDAFVESKRPRIVAVDVQQDGGTADAGEGVQPPDQERVAAPEPFGPGGGRALRRRSPGAEGAMPRTYPSPSRSGWTFVQWKPSSSRSRSASRK